MANLIKPLTKITNPQALALIERWIARRSKVATPPAPPIETSAPGLDPGLIASVRPYAHTSESTMGQMLDTQVPRGAPPKLLSMPIEEAMQTYMGDPNRFRANPAITKAPITHYFPTEKGGPLDATGALGGGIAKELVNIRNPIPTTWPTTNAINNELIGKNIPLPVAKPTVPAMEVDQAGRKLIRGPAPAPTPAAPVPKPTPTGPLTVKDALTLSMQLDDVWATMGGAKTVAGRTWKNYLEQSSIRRSIKTPKDYFISVAIRYKNDPKETQRLAPREVNLLKQIYKAYEDSTGINPMKLVGGE